MDISKNQWRSTGGQSIRTLQVQWRFLLKVIQDCQSAHTPDQTNIKRYQIRLHKEFDRTVVNKTGEGLLMMMMVKKCIWNVQPDAAAHFFPSTQSMNHRADENAPRRCTRFFFFLAYRLALWWTFFWASQCSAHTQWSEGLSTGFVLLSHTINLWLKAHLNSYKKWRWMLARFLFFCKWFLFVFRFSQCVMVSVSHFSLFWW